MANKIKMVLALGGNALQANPKDMTPQAQLLAAEETAVAIVKLIKEGYDIALAHGNGPQVGQIISVSSPTALSTMNSSEPVPPIAPESARTGITVNPRRLKILR